MIDVVSKLHAACDLERGDVVRIDGEEWTISTRFLEPPDVLELDLYRSDATMNLHIGIDHLVGLVVSHELVAEADPAHS